MFDKLIDNIATKNESLDGGRIKIILIASIVGIAANGVFAAIKLIVGFAANSISIVSDAVNNLTDALSSVVTLIGLRLSNLPPSRKHPLGYGRIEYISGMIVSVIVLVTGIEFFKTSVERVISPQETNYVTIQLVIIIITIIGKWLLSRFIITAGKKTDSDALIASGTDAKMDVLATLLTVIGAFITKEAGMHLDGYIGILLSFFIIYTGIGLVRETISHILGERPNKELADDIKMEIKKYEPVIGAYDLIIHNYGPATKFGTINLEIPDYATVEKAYEAMDSAQMDIYNKFGIYFTFGLYSVNTYDEEIVRMRKEITQLVKDIDGAESIHNFHYDKENRILRFDIIVNFNVKSFVEFRNTVSQKIKEKHPACEVFINVDLDYS